MKRNIAIFSSVPLFSLIIFLTTAGGGGHAAGIASLSFEPGPSASGHGNFRYPDGALRTLSFHARTDKNGVTDGSFVVNNREIDNFLKGDIDCLYINGNYAQMSGTVTSSNVAAVPVGTKTRFAVQDNGEGSKAPPDLMSSFNHSPVPCNQSPFLGFSFVADGGNIQVNP